MSHFAKRQIGMARFNSGIFAADAWAKVSLLSATPYSTEDSLVSVDTVNSKIIANEGGWHRVDTSLQFWFGSVGVTRDILVRIVLRTGAVTTYVASTYQTALISEKTYESGEASEVKLSTVIYMLPDAWVEVEAYPVNTGLATYDTSTLSVERLPQNITI